MLYKKAKVLVELETFTTVNYIKVLKLTLHSPHHLAASQQKRLI